MVSSGAVTLCVDARILGEYEEVLSRPKFGFEPDDTAALLDYIEFRGEIAASSPLSIRLPDLDDEPFLEVAIAASADCLVTGNLARFPSDACEGVPVMSPGEFVEAYRAGSAGPSAPR